MFGNKLSEYKKYMTMLKTSIRSDCLTIKRRLQNFPLKSLKHGDSLSFLETEHLIIDGKEYSLKDAIKQSLDYYEELEKESKPTSYNDILKEFIRSKNQKSIHDSYNYFNGELKKRYEVNTEKLYFCLCVVKGLVKLIQSYNNERRVDK